MQLQGYLIKLLVYLSKFKYIHLDSFKFYYIEDGYVFIKTW